MKKKDALSELADDIGILCAGILFFFSYLMVRHPNVGAFEVAFCISMAIMFTGSFSMFFMVSLRHKLSSRASVALTSSVLESSKITPKFVLHYSLLTFAYLLPVLFYHNDWVKYGCIASATVTVAMLMNMFAYNKIIKREL